MAYVQEAINTETPPFGLDSPEAEIQTGTGIAEAQTYQPQTGVLHSAFSRAVEFANDTAAALGGRVQGLAGGAGELFGGVRRHKLRAATALSTVALGGEAILPAIAGAREGDDAPAVAQTADNPSGKAAVVYTSSKANESDPAYQAALDRMNADPRMQGEWGGDGWFNVYTTCPSRALILDPRRSLKLRYDPASRSFNANMEAINPSRYCNLIGSYTETVSIQKQSKTDHTKFKKIGNTVVHKDGLPEVLSFYYGLSPKYRKHSFVVNGVGNLCVGKASERPKVRVKVSYAFNGFKTQTFQHSEMDPDSTDPAPGAKDSHITYYSRPKPVAC